MIYSLDIFGDSWDISCRLLACLSLVLTLWMERRGLGEAQEKRQVGIIRPGRLSAESSSAINIPGPCRQGEQQPYLSVAPSKHHPTVSYMGGGIIFAFFLQFFLTNLLNDCREARKKFVPLGFPPNLGPKLSLKAENGQKWGQKCKNRNFFLGTLTPTQWTTNGRNFKKNSEKKVPSRALGSGLGYGHKWGFWPFLLTFLVKSYGNQ